MNQGWPFTDLNNIEKNRLDWIGEEKKHITTFSIKNSGREDEFNKNVVKQTLSNSTSGLVYVLNAISSRAKHKIEGFSTFTLTQLSHRRLVYSHQLTKKYNSIWNGRG